MKLLTKEILRKLPALGSADDVRLADKVVQVKFFLPGSSWTWYAVEFDPESGEFFGLVEGIEWEWGSFMLQELEEIRLHGLFKVERDRYFRPARVSDLIAQGVLPADVA